MSEPVLFGYPLHLLFLYFILYSFLGWCVETVYCSVKSKRLVPRGFLFGPICPIYGVGVLMMICWFAPFMDSPVLFYLVATVCMSAWEYLVGWLLETITHMKYWDYSANRFNLQGRICLSVSLTWGILAYVILYWVHPLAERLILKISLHGRYLLCAGLLAILLVDVITTIRKLALSVRLLNRLEQARVQLALGRAELEDALQSVREDLSERRSAGDERRRQQVARLQRNYDKLLERTEHSARRFLKRYSKLSERRGGPNLPELRRLQDQLRQTVRQARSEHRNKKSKS
ncbi:MAG: hypothetical protein LUB63_08295 [Oscillospiraceae bacterium]|nr:hypothetical protein [Oscillospiraceae bacterium]